MPGSRKLGRPTDHRKSMLRGMVTFLLENGKIETTVTRAKEVRAMTEKMITLGKNDTLHSRRQVLSYVTKEDVVKKLFDDVKHRKARKMKEKYIDSSSRRDRLHLYIWMPKDQPKPGLIVQMTDNT